MVRFPYLVFLKCSLSLHFLWRKKCFMRFSFLINMAFLMVKKDMQPFVLCLLVQSQWSREALPFTCIIALNVFSGLFQFWLRKTKLGLNSSLQKHTLVRAYPHLFPHHKGQARKEACSGYSLGRQGWHFYLTLIPLFSLKNVPFLYSGTECIGYPRATVTKCHKLIVQNDRNFLSDSSGSWKYEIKVSTGPWAL